VTFTPQFLSGKATWGPEFLNIFSCLGPMEPFYRRKTLVFFLLLVRLKKVGLDSFEDHLNVSKLLDFSLFSWITSYFCKIVKSKVRFAY
jgi:hypothetical protein